MVVEVRVIRSVIHYSVKEIFRLSMDFCIFIITGIVLYFKMIKMRKDEKNPKISQTERLFFTFNPKETNTQKVVVVGGVAVVAVGDATVLREAVPTTTPIDAVRTG